MYHKNQERSVPQELQHCLQNVSFKEQIPALPLKSMKIEFCLFVCLILCSFVRLFACLLVCLFACLLVCLFVCLLVCLFACLLVCLFACLLVCLFACLFVCLSACLLVCLFACLLACLFVCLFALSFVCLFVLAVSFSFLLVWFGLFVGLVCFVLFSVFLCNCLCNCNGCRGKKYIRCQKDPAKAGTLSQKERFKTKNGSCSVDT